MVKGVKAYYIKDQERLGKWHSGVRDLMMNILVLVVLSSMLSVVSGDSSLNNFILDIVSTFTLTSPTIVFNEKVPEICMTQQWVLCVSNTHQSEQDELADHIVILSLNRKQDGIIFVGGEGTHEKLLEHLLIVDHIQYISMFTSNCPVFMPIEHKNLMKLRLDSNIIFYEEGASKYNLVDIFAVNGGPPIVLEFGTWDHSNGMLLKQRINRWERRTDLMGAEFINTLWDNSNWADFIYDDNKTLIGSSGTFQEMLFYMTDRLNLTMVTLDAYKVEINGTRPPRPCPLMLDLHLTDVCSGGVPIKWAQDDVDDLTIPIDRQPQTLIAGVPKGTAPDAWVYLEVFELPQWILFFSFLLLISTALPIALRITREIIQDSTKGDSALDALGMVYLFTIQQGSHTERKNLSIRIMSMTTAMATLLMFIYYGNDITAKMTAGAPPHPVRTFDDVIALDYKVIVVGFYHLNLLKNSPLGSGKRLVYEKYFKENDPWDGKENELFRPWSGPNLDWAKDVIKEDLKILFYCADSCVDLDTTPDDRILSLKMHDTFHTLGGYALQNNSEYIDIYNHYLLKELEHGIVDKSFKFSLPSVKVGLSEPEPLAIRNVMFPFSCLGFCMIASVVMGAIEFLVAKIKRQQEGKAMEFIRTGAGNEQWDTPLH